MHAEHVSSISYHQRNLPLTGGSDEQRTAHSTPRRRSHEGATAIGTSLSPTVSRDEHPEDTVVPLEGRILRDAQGKVIFVGDCAPLSFLQTVRHLIASAVDEHDLPAQSSRDSIIEVARPGSADQQQSLSVALHEVRPLVQQYTVAVSGLIDLFERDQLMSEISSWATGAIIRPHESAAAVFYLVLAIGAQETQEAKAEGWFTYARDILLKHLVNSMNVSTVQGFSLVAIYMLRAFQPNGAYLYFCKLSLCNSKRTRLTIYSFGRSDRLCNWPASNRSQCILWRFYQDRKGSHLEECSRCRSADQ